MELGYLARQLDVCTERRFQIREQRLEQRAEGQCHSTRIISYLTLYI